MKEDEWRSRGVEVNENVTSKHGVVLHHFDEGLQFFNCFEDAAIAVEVDIQTWPANGGRGTSTKGDSNCEQGKFMRKAAVAVVVHCSALQ
jgi:hypothetical protein